jgi:hypothetical protein
MEMEGNGAPTLCHMLQSVNSTNVHCLYYFPLHFRYGIVDNGSKTCLFWLKNAFGTMTEAGLRG